MQLLADRYALPVVVGVLGLGFGVYISPSGDPITKLRTTRLARVLGWVLIVLGVVIAPWWAIAVYFEAETSGAFSRDREVPFLFIVLEARPQVAAAWVLALVGGIVLARKTRR